MMAQKYKRAKTFIVSLLIYLVAVSIGHSIYAQSQIVALESNVEYLVNEIARIQPDLIESTKQKLSKVNK